VEAKEIFNFGMNPTPSASRRPPDRGFTLIELLIYVAVLAVVGLVGASLFLTISRSYFRDQARNEVSQNMRLVTQVIQQAVRAATKVNTASSSTLELAMAETAKNPTRFTLSGGTLYKQEGAGSQVALTSTASCSSVSYKVYSDANGDLHGWAWSDQYGWWSFNSVEAGSPISYKVSINTTTGDFSGWAWSENVGWLSFNCDNSGIGNTCATANYKVKAAARSGRPINSVRVTITISYKTSNPLLQASDTYDFSVALGQPSLVTVDNITPGSGSGTVSVTITGTNFQTGAEVKLSRVGEADIFPTSACTLGGSTSFSCTFDLTGKAQGKWDVVVTNPDGQKGILPAGFEIL